LKTDQTIPQNSSKNNAQEHIERVLRTFFRPGEVFEICVIKPRGIESKWWQDRAVGKKPIVCGWFDDPAEAAKIAAKIDAAHKPEGIYFTLNPVNKALLARANNRLVAGMNRTTDKDIAVIRHVLIDVDPERPSGISSTDAELEAARNLIRRVVPQWDGLLAASGNGMHKILRLPDLPNTDETKAVIERFLKAANDFYRCRNTETDIALKVDTSVSNPARLTKLYGTLVRKGDHVSDRPHRRSWVLHTPNPWPTVTLEDLAAWTSEHATETDPVDTPQGRETTATGDGRRLDVRRYLEAHGVEVVGTKRHGTATLYLLRHCVFDEGHTAKESAIGQHDDGQLFYQCFHDSCQGHTWKEARALISGDKPLTEYMEGGKPFPVRSAAAGQPDKATQMAPMPEATFPRIPYPLDVLPADIASSLRALARAVGVSVQILPTVLFVALGAAVGRTISVSPKESWQSPLIFWGAVIGESGTGKTPAANALVRLFHKKQREDNDRAKAQYEEWRSLSKKDREEKPEPPKTARARFVSDLTLEGIRAHVEAGHGGVLCIQDELSAIITGLNQYKGGRGNDREAWLKLFDGSPAHVVRVSGSVFISGARLCLYGGIQPAIFARAFDGLLKSDGTLFRYLLVVEPVAHHEVDEIPWADHHRRAWELLLERAMNWADSRDPDDTHLMMFSPDAQQAFFAWRNELNDMRYDLPPLLRGFIPKAVEYAVRLTGAIRLLHDFSACSEPARMLGAEDFDRARQVVMFHLGQAEEALRLFDPKNQHPAVEVSERTLHLASVLTELRKELDSGRLAVGYIHEAFNAKCQEHLRIKSPHAMGSLLRSCGLTISEGRHNANGKRAVRCLVWDKKADAFLEYQYKTSLQSLQSLPTEGSSAFAVADIEKSKSAKSANSSSESRPMQTLQTLKNKSLHPESRMQSSNADNADNADDILKDELFYENTPSAPWVQPDDDASDTDDEVEVVI
jgi:hypothetical protein